MKSGRFWISLLVIVTVGIGLGGCLSYEDHAARRTERLRQIYPLKTTTREDVQKKWGEKLPDWTELRPASGWAGHANRYLAEKMPLIEKQCGQPIARMDRYWGVDGFMSLCYCWFYYDATDHLLEVEWMYKSD